MNAIASLFAQARETRERLAKTAPAAVTFKRPADNAAPPKAETTQGDKE